MDTGYVFSHSFHNHADARRCFEANRVHAFIAPIGNVQLINERNQTVIAEARSEVAECISAHGLDL